MTAHGTPDHQPLRIVTVVGSPRAGSRTRLAAESLANALATTLAESGTPAETASTIDLAELASGLLVPWSLSAEAAEAVATVQSSTILLLATPTFKGSITGILKLLLDTIPSGGLEGVVAIPVAIAGAPAHRHLAEIALRPILAELGAATPVPSFLLLEEELGDVQSAADDYATAHAPVAAAVAQALAVRRKE